MSIVLTIALAVAVAIVGIVSLLLLSRTITERKSNDELLRYHDDTSETSAGSCGGD